MDLELPGSFEGDHPSNPTRFRCYWHLLGMMKSHYTCQIRQERVCLRYSRHSIIMILLFKYIFWSTIVFSSNGMLLSGGRARRNEIRRTAECTSSSSLQMIKKLSDSLLAEILNDFPVSPPLPVKESASKAKGFQSPVHKRNKNLLIIGLGNPGDEYDSTRHNIGFRILDEFAASKKVTMKFTSKFNADYGAIRIGDKNIGLLKPSTYINNSGGPIKKIMENFKLTARDILVIADDVALDCGNLRLREKGSHGGHNGHRDIEAVLKTQEYARLRVGVSGPGRKAMADHVLGLFHENEMDLVSIAVNKSCRTIEDWIINDESQLVINRCNAQPPRVESLPPADLSQ